MIPRNFYCSLCFVVLSISTLAQNKLELERKIDVRKVPKSAVKWLNRAYHNPTKVTWYKESSLGKTSYEAKFKWNKRKHSVEFNEYGVIEDIEIRIQFKEVSNKVREHILLYLQTNYVKHKIKKIQLQWSGDEQQLVKKLQGEEVIDIIIRYEIEFYGKDRAEDDLWEGLFDDKGQLVRKRKVVLRPVDNLIY